MKNLKLLFPFLLLLLSNIIFAQTINTESVTDAISRGDSKTLVSYLCNSPYVSIVGNTISDKTEIIKALNNLFYTEKPESVKIIHTGQKDDSVFCIAFMTIDKKEYRIYLLLKNNKLHELRIEQ